MSSFAKAHKAGRKTHKERSQPSFRRKFGFLEKGKDWKLRREDFHFKQKRIKALTEQARNRNPDEFYFAMINQSTKEGVHQLTRAGKEYSAEEMRLLKTQDSNYISLKVTEESRKIDRLKESLHMTAVAGGAAGSGGVAANQRTVFVDAKEEGRRGAQQRVKEVQAEVRREREAAKRKGRTSARQGRRYEELVSRVKREEQLLRVHHQLDTERKLMGKGRRRKIKQADGTVVYKWARERKK